MSSLVWNKRSMARQRATRKTKQPRIYAAAGALYRRIVSALLTMVVVFAGLSLLVLSFGIHLPFLGDRTPRMHTVAVAPSEIKPHVVTNANPHSCLASYQQTDSLFASCPSFLQDYTKQSDRSINKHNFNVYTGPPIANNEAQYYADSKENLRVEQGSLVLQAHTKPKQGYRYTSARIDTRGKADFLYGKLVIRAKLPSGVGTWPAIWLLPSQPRYARLSPESNQTRYLNDGEIDIVEAVGVQPHIVNGVAHSLSHPVDGPDRSYYGTIMLPDNTTTFHDYELDWTPTTLTFVIDGQPYFTYSKQADADWQSWPFDQPFHLVMNLALGGSWAGSDRTDFPLDGIDQSALPDALRVQAIRYYPYVGPR
jgi:hypothetical protein